MSLALGLMAMSPPKPTAGPASRAKRLVMWWEGWPRMVALALAGIGALGVAFGTLQFARVLIDLDSEGGGVEIDVPVDQEEPSYFERHPRNVLLLGSDTRANLSEEEQVMFGSEETVEGERSDTIILMHIDPDSEEAIAIHFPRDLRVDIAGPHGFDKINAAYEIGGPQLAIRTIREFTGLPIHNYVEVDLAGFQDLIDTIGGVRICVDRPLVDQLAGLNIPTAGCHTLDGDMALAFARARHIEGDTIPDFSRIGRQQQLMRAVMNKVMSAPSLLNPSLISRAVGNVTTDDTVSAADFLYLGQKLRELAQEDPSGASTLDFRVVPGVPEFIGEVSYVIPTDEAEEMFRRLRNGRPLGELGKVLINTERSPAQVNVAARDAGDPAETEATTGFLKRAGFIVHEPGPAPPGYEESVILYRPGSEPNAEAVHAYFEQLPMEEAPPELFGDTVQVLVLVGPDFAELTDG
jgi:LCP family protein required for cell wall assembly